MTDIPRASVRELAHKIKGYGTPRFTFFLGAGASKQSGIPIAGDMIRHFKEQIIARSCPDEHKTDDERKSWLEAEDWYKADGSEYCKCFERFEAKEIGRQRYIESIIENRSPSFGYVVLANLMASNHINTIITTNFDDLVYSACTTFTGIRPIVYAYGVMASEMRLTAQRPKILKLHGDYLYSALKNTGPELDEQDANMARQLRQVLSEYGLVVVGYGGGDESVMDVLSDISDKNDLYWCARRGEKLNDRVEKLLRDKRGFLVEIEGFDEMMNEVRRTVGFDVKRMVGSIEERRNQIIEHLKKFEPQYLEDLLPGIDRAVREPATKSVEDGKISALGLAVAAYHASQAGDFSKAVELYRKAIELDPKYALAHNNLGNTLFKLRLYEEAEASCRRATELDPNDAVAYTNLGNALRELKRPGEAEAAYRKAIELDPNDAVAYDSLVNLLRLVNRESEALTFAEKARQLQPQSAVYALSLAAIHKKLGHQAEAELYVAETRALLKPDEWYNAACLESVCGNADGAIENLRRATQLPKYYPDWTRIDPDFEWLRDDPRFKEIVGEEPS